MPTPISAEAVHNLVVKHQIALTRYSNKVVYDTIAFLNRIEADVVSRLSQTTGESLQDARLEELLTEIRQIQAAGFAVINGRLNGDLAATAGAEIDFAERLIEISAPTTVQAGVFSGAPALAQVMAAVQARPFSGRFLKDWLAGTEEGIAARVRDVIRQGFVEGTPTEQIVRTLRGTAAARYSDGILEMTRRSTEAMVRTAINHTASVAAQATYAGLGVKFVIWTSTLDSRTTLICASRSETVYPIDSGPRPPAHVNCRSVIRPQTAPIPGLKPWKPPSYGDWLKAQPAAVQDDVLGPTRAKLFRNGGLAIDRFVDRAGQTLTIDQLRARDASAFAAAHL